MANVEWLEDVTPSLAMEDGLDATRTNAIDSTQPTARIVPCGIQVSDLLDLSTGQLGHSMPFAYIASAVKSSISLVFSGSPPMKIGETVVSSSSVSMKAFHSFGTGANKRCENKPMYEPKDLFATIVKTYHEIACRHNAKFQHQGPGPSTLSVVPRSHSPFIRDFI